MRRHSVWGWILNNSVVGNAATELQTRDWQVLADTATAAFFLYLSKFLKWKSLKIMA